MITTLGGCICVQFSSFFFKYRGPGVVKKSREKNTPVNFFFSLSLSDAFHCSVSFSVVVVVLCVCVGKKLRIVFLFYIMKSAQYFFSLFFFFFFVFCLKGKAINRDGATAGGSFVYHYRCALRECDIISRPVDRMRSEGQS